MELHPQKALDELERDYKAYHMGAVERRNELATTLRRSIRRAEIESGNLRDAERDYDQRVLQKRLIGLIELAKGALPQT